MAWLSGLAGKAEDFLNQIDQGAATALTTRGKGTGSTSSAANYSLQSTKTDINSQVNDSRRSAPLSDVSVFSSADKRHTGRTEHRSSGYASSVSSMTRDQSRDEDKLIAFLNEPSAPEQKANFSLSRKSSSSSIVSAPAQAMQALFGGNNGNSFVHVGDSVQRADTPSEKHASYVLPDLEVTSLRSRQNELQKQLDSKDSQLSVLRIKLQEANQQLEVRAQALTKLQAEKDRLLRDNMQSDRNRDSTLDTLQHKYREISIAIEEERESAKRAEAEYLGRIQRLEDEKSLVRQELMELQKTITDEKLRTRDVLDQLKLAKYNLEANKQEFDEYKQKAQRILQAKEALIGTLKAGVTSTSEQSELQILLTETQQERDMLKEDLQQAHIQQYTLRAEVQELENQLAAEQRASLETQRHLQEQAQSFQQSAAQYREQAEQLKMECQYLQDDLHRQQLALHAKLQDKDAELARLSGQVAARSMSIVTESDLELRVRQMTENLISKQAYIETLQTEKQSLGLQLERTERLYREAESAAIQASGSLHIGNVEDGYGGLHNRLPTFFRENPYDTGVTRSVKRAYTSVDALSVKLGVFLRRYPIARVVVFIYVCQPEMPRQKIRASRSSDVAFDDEHDESSKPGPHVYHPPDLLAPESTDVPLPPEFKSEETVFIEPFGSIRYDAPRLDPLIAHRLKSTPVNSTLTSEDAEGNRQENVAMNHVPDASTLDSAQHFVGRRPRPRLRLQKLPRILELIPQSWRMQPEQLADLLMSRILYDQDDLIVLDKPWGLSVVRGRGVSIPLSRALKPLAERLSYGKLYLCHRLDSDCSGCIMIAKSQLRFSEIQDMFKERRILKQYLCITRGVPDHSEGTIDTALRQTKIGANFKTICCLPSQNPNERTLQARTEYKVLSRGIDDKCALVQLRAQTGIRHQLRAHLGFGIQCPVLGDYKYSDLFGVRPPQILPGVIIRQLDIPRIPRPDLHLPIYLHASQLTIPDVLGGKNLVVRSELPRFFLYTMKLLKLKL